MELPRIKRYAVAKSQKKLLISVSALVIGSGVVISLLETKRFSNSLREAAITQGEYLSQELGILRIGISEKHYRSEVFKLWLQMSAITLGILLLALSASFLFIRRITRPLSALAKAAENIDENNLELSLEPGGRDEVGSLASSFKHMGHLINASTRSSQPKTRCHNFLPPAITPLTGGQWSLRLHPFCDPRHRSGYEIHIIHGCRCVPSETRNLTPETRILTPEKRNKKRVGIAHPT